MNVLVLAAHPDDEVLGCGGTIIKHVERDDEISIVILGDGITSRYKTEELNTKKVREEVKIITEQSKEVAKFLSVKYIKNYNDNFCVRFDTKGTLHFTHIIEDEIKKLCPDIIYTHHYGDNNKDHRIVFEALMPAVRPVGEKRISQILSFETPSSTEWNAQITKNVFLPNYFVPFEKETIDKKIKAMSLYSTEFRDFPHPRSSKAIESVARYRGIMCGYEYAEAFSVVREINDLS